MSGFLEEESQSQLSRSEMPWDVVSVVLSSSENSQTIGTGGEQFITSLLVDVRKAAKVA